MYLGNIPATSFEAVKKDRFTSLTGTGVTLSHSVSNVQDIVVWVNSVKQDYNNYTVSGTALTLGGSLVSADVVQVLYVGRTFQTVNPAADSVTASQIADNAISEEHLDPTIITGLTAEATIATDDTILIHDTSASALRKMTRANFVSGVGGDNTPAWKATNSSSSQSISNNSFTKAQYNAEYWDTNNDFDKDTNYRFTVSVAGKYHIGAYIIMDNTGDQSYLRVSIYKNGSETNPNAQGLNGISESSGTTPHQCNVTTNIDCAVGDYFEVYIKHNHGSSRDWRTEYGNVFYAYKLIGV